MEKVKCRLERWKAEKMSKVGWLFNEKLYNPDQDSKLGHIGKLLNTAIGIKYILLYS